MTDVEALADNIVAALDYDDAEDLLTLLQSEDPNDLSRLSDALNEALEDLTR